MTAVAVAGPADANARIHFAASGNRVFTVPTATAAAPRANREMQPEFSTYDVKVIGCTKLVPRRYTDFKVVSAGTWGNTLPRPIIATTDVIEVAGADVEVVLTRPGRMTVRVEL